jgi:hypothetical protein
MLGFATGQLGWRTFTIGYISDWEISDFGMPL